MNNRHQLKHRQRGMALLSVLLILVVVTLALTQIQNASYQDLERIEGRYLQQQGWAYQLGAEALGRQMLTDQRLREQPLWWEGVRGKPVSYPVNEGLLSLRVRDLRSCFNLNHLSGISSQDLSHSLPELLPWRLYLSQLVEEEPWLPDLEPDAFIDLARDWMDSDNNALPLGAETGQYLLDDPPRVTANQRMADLSEVNWWQPQDRQRFRQLPSSVCLLPDSRLQLNINTLPFENIGLLWALMEGQVSRQALEDWWHERPEVVGYQQLDLFWAELGEHHLPDDPAWKQRVGARLIFVSDYYRMTIEMRLNNHELIFESDIYLSPQGQTRVYARRRGPVDGHASLMDAVSRQE